MLTLHFLGRVCGQRVEVEFLNSRHCTVQAIMKEVGRIAAKEGQLMIEKKMARRRRSRDVA